RRTRRAALSSPVRSRLLQSQPTPNPPHHRTARAKTRISFPRRNLLARHPPLRNSPRRNRSRPRHLPKIKVLRSLPPSCRSKRRPTSINRNQTRNVPHKVRRTNTHHRPENLLQFLYPARRQGHHADTSLQIPTPRYLPPTLRRENQPRRQLGPRQRLA